MQCQMRDEGESEPHEEIHPEQVVPAAVIVGCADLSDEAGD